MTEAAVFVDLLDADQNAFDTILNAFELSVRARSKLQEDYQFARNLMNSSEKAVSRVISSQNKEYRQASLAQRCYINATQSQSILTFRRWAIIAAIKEGGSIFHANEAATFNQAWIEQGNGDMFSGGGTEPSPAGTTLPVLKVLSFTGTNSGGQGGRGGSQIDWNVLPPNIDIKMKTLILMATHGMSSLMKPGKRLRRSETCSANDAPLTLYSHMLMMAVPALIIGASLT